LKFGFPVELEEEIPSGVLAFHLTGAGAGKEKCEFLNMSVFHAFDGP
jgi:hypothetical protein